MKNQCEYLAISKLEMPLIGCGLDRLDWLKVKDIIKTVFEKTDIEILVCKLWGCNYVRLHPMSLSNGYSR